MLAVRAGFHKRLVQIANSEDPDQIASSESVLIWVCPVCLDLFGWQQGLEILECQSKTIIVVVTTSSRNEIRLIQIKILGQ